MEFEKLSEIQSMQMAESLLRGTPLSSGEIATKTGLNVFHIIFMRCQLPLNGELNEST